MSLTNAVALDCEMVGSYNNSILARVSIVNQYGHVVLDEYVRPTAAVTDYRSCISGVKKNDLVNGGTFSTVQAKVINALQGRIVVGHSLHFDLAALNISHPESRIRDLAKYAPLMSNGQAVALKTLARNYLGRSLQQNEHDSVEDAKACMDIYLKFASSWN